jgi:predicted RNA binding protein YcfA (HicA-like mRNA interferase family)
VTGNELIRKLRRLGAAVDPSHGKGSHQAVVLRGRKTFVPVHGKRDLSPGVLRAILRQLELKPRDLE